jgi:glycosyltransferase involved in cell wall biosynthesis
VGSYSILSSLKQASSSNDSAAEISVILPVFNRETLVETSLRSILAQSHRPLDVVVVDDGSTDGSTGVVERFGEEVRLIRQDHAGVSVARNCGLQSSHGSLIAFLDSDDVWPIDWLADAAARMEREPDIAIVHGTTEIVRTATADNHQPRFIADGNHVCRELLGSLLIRRECFGRVGPFDETLDTGEDLDWIARAKELGCAFASISDRVLEHRIHADNMTNDSTRAKRGIAEMIKRKLDRRRRRE